MAFDYCNQCRKYFNANKAHACPAAQPVAKPRKKWDWRREWAAATAADAVIAKRFRNVKTMSMFR